MFSETKPYSTSLKSLSICQLISLFVPGGDSDLCMSLWNDTPHLSSIFARHLFWEMKKNMIFRFFLLGSFQFAVIYVSHWVMTFWIQRWKWKWIWILFWVQAFFCFVLLLFSFFCLKGDLIKPSIIKTYEMKMSFLQLNDLNN